ncbi:MAG: ABC transporter substrate-binding protein [Haloarculaceae archaeon]
MSGIVAFDSMPRRRFVEAVGSGALAGLAGCTGGDESSGGTPGGTQTTGGDGSSADGGAGGDGGSSTEIHLLTDYSSESWQRRWEETIIPSYESETGNSVNLEYTGMQGNARNRLMTLIQSGDTPNSFQSTPDTVAPLVMRGQTVSVTDLVNELESRYGSILGKELIVHGGEVRNVPHGLYYGALNYRADIYDRLSLSEPTTWDDLLSNAEAIDTDADVAARGFGLSAVKAGKSSAEFESVLNTAGAHLFEWKDREAGTIQIWFPEDPVVEALSFMEQLGEYSPDPSSISWGPGLKYWAGGRIAQQMHLNAWPAGVAAGAGADDIARHTGVVKYPNKAGVDPDTRGFNDIDTATLFDTDGADATREFFRMLYGSPERVAGNHAMEPMRFIPAYEGFMDTEHYQSIDIFQQYDGHLLELNRKIVSDVAPELSSPKRPRTLERMYVLAGPMLANMVNQVVIQGRNKSDAYRECRERIADRLERARSFGD